LDLVVISNVFILTVIE